jgi:hypothetical protein
MTRVFVSSIIEGFQAYRDAARRAVALVGFTPVMAEDFPAQSRAPRAACLDGVRSSDIYLGILGPSYGCRTESGLSATEEEFDEACARSLSTLIFSTTAGLDSEQAAFLERVAGRWGEGIFYGRFGTPEELKDAVIRALSAIKGETPALSEGEASARLEALLNPVTGEWEEVVLSVALVADTGGQPLIQLEELEQLASDMRNLLKSLPELGEGGEILGKERSVELWRAPTNEEPFAFFEAFDDGRFVCALGQRPRGRTDLAASFIIDANLVEQDLGRIIETFYRVLTRLDPRGSTRTVYIQGTLKGVQHKAFNAVPQEAVDTITVPWHALPNQLPFPSRALRVRTQELGRSKALAATLRATIKRIFDEALRQPR